MVESVKETTEYESLIGVKVELKGPASLENFLYSEEEIEEAQPEWKKNWVGMPEYENEANPPYKKIQINFRDEEDYNEFAKLIGQNLTEKTKSIWHPKLDKDKNALRRWIEE